MTNTQFSLSWQVRAHEMDVKDVAVANQDLICSASRDQTVISWKRTSANTFHVNHRYSAHTHFVNSLVCLPPTTEYPNGLIVSGGSDKHINVFDPESPAEPLYCLIGHEENVCTLAVTADGGIISGSWDKTIKVWKNWNCIQTLKGHANAVWSVLGLVDGSILSASADKTIKMWNGGKCVKTITGHTDVVRGLALAPDHGFISCSNDGTLRLWTLNGDCISEMVGHTSFVYKVRSFSNGEFISCGEDRSVRVWKDGNCVQIIKLPCISVWSVDVFPNGDFVCGGNDGFLRVFSRDESKRASAEDMAEFDKSVATHAIPSKQVGDVDKSKLPGSEALADRGKKDGQVVMIRNGQTVEAHQWSEATREWQKIGEVVDAVGTSRKQMYQNVEYDYVFDIDIGDGVPPLKLPYNVSENPYQTAQNFIHLHELPQDYLDTIANFITTNSKGHTIGIGDNSSPAYVDPFTGGSRYTPATNSMSTYQPHSSGISVGTKKSQFIPCKEFVFFKTANYQAILSKTVSLNSEVEKSMDTLSFALTKQDEGRLESLVKELQKANGVKVHDDDFAVIQKIALHWPATHRFPGLDFLRLCVLHSSSLFQDSSSSQVFCEAIGLAGCFSADETKTLGKSEVTNVMLGLRIFCNMFATEMGKKAIIGMREQVLNVVKHCWQSTTNLNLRLAFVSLLLNMSVALAGDRDETFKVDALSLAVEVLKKEVDSEIQYRCLITLGTLIYGDKIVCEAGKLMNVKESVLKVVGKEGRVRAVQEEVAGLL